MARLGRPKISEEGSKVITISLPLELVKELNKRFLMGGYFNRSSMLKNIIERGLNVYSNNN